MAAVIGGQVARHTLGRQRPVMVDDGRGGVEETWPNPVEASALPGWALDAGNTLADAQNRDGALVQWTARGPYGADVERHDRIVVDGATYQIEGAIVRQPGPTARTSHTILLLKNWEG